MQKLIVFLLIIIVALLSAVVYHFYNPNIAFEGVVYKDNVPLANARVIALAEGNERKAFTNERGEFSLILDKSEEGEMIQLLIGIENKMVYSGLHLVGKKAYIKIVNE